MEKKKTYFEKIGYRGIIEWVLIIAIPLVFYLTGWHTEVSGRLQQAVLWTGLIQAETDLPPEEHVKIQYDMPLVTLEGKVKNFSSFKGKVVFLNFWATWCPPCIAEMPNIQALYENFGSNDDIVFVMVSLDESVPKAQRFIVRKEFTFPVYQLTNGRPTELQSTTIPTTYIINKAGFIVSERRGMANYNTSAFHSFLKKLSAE